MTGEQLTLVEVKDAANAELSRVEQIKRYRILDTEWAPGGDELSATMKLKRKQIADKYRAIIDEMYSGATP